MLEDIEKIHLKILKLYIRDYSMNYSILEITKLLDINYSNAFKRIKELINEQILAEKKFGKSNSISLNLSNPAAIHLISFVEQMQKIDNKIIDDIIKEIIHLDAFACIGLFGSRVSGKAKKDSDWDIFVITEHRKDVEKVMSKFPYASNIQIQVFGIDEFKESLLTVEETVVKHIVGNKRIIYNPYPFYNIIKEWEMIKYAPKY
jgi:predicted nucleotidyltransferase